MKYLETRRNELEDLSIEAMYNSEFEKAVKYQFAADELSELKRQIRNEELYQAIENLKTN
jgi:hypothetical protein